MKQILLVLVLLTTSTAHAFFFRRIFGCGGGCAPPPPCEVHCGSAPLYSAPMPYPSAPLPAPSYKPLNPPYYSPSRPVAPATAPATTRPNGVNTAAWHTRFANADIPARGWALGFPPSQVAGATDIRAFHLNCVSSAATSPIEKLTLLLQPGSNGNVAMNVYPRKHLTLAELKSLDSSTNYPGTFREEGTAGKITRVTAWSGSYSDPSFEIRTKIDKVDPKKSRVLLRASFYQQGKWNSWTCAADEATAFPIAKAPAAKPGSGAPPYRPPLPKPGTPATATATATATAKPPAAKSPTATATGKPKRPTT